MVAAAVVAVLVAAGCGSGAPDRTEVLADLADETIVPTYVELAERADELAVAVDGVCGAPSEASVEIAVDALVGARDVWSRSEAVWVGPAMERRSWARIDWPIAPDEIEELIVDPSAELTLDYLGTRIGADQRGLGAIEYLVAGEPSEAADALADPDRCAYLTGITEVVAEEATLLAGDWTTGEVDGEPTREAFVADEGGVDSLVNDSLFLLEAMSDLELGRGLGLVSSGEPDPEAIVEGAGGYGADDLAAHLIGLRAVLVGAAAGADDADNSAGGLAPLLTDELVSRLTTELDAADAAVAAVDGPLRQAATERPGQVTAARDAIKAVQITVATEVVAQLGVTIGFSDADGDTGA
ncbi:MAG: imelysin family protein [Actinomycetota bacterium]